eukprot:10720930-Alexandrium_andersonii.AAC.1
MAGLGLGGAGSRVPCAFRVPRLHLPEKRCPIWSRALQAHSKRALSTLPARSGCFLPPEAALQAKCAPE